MTPTKGTMDEETKEGVRRMTQSLTDQKTIEQLSRAGMMAKLKREELSANAPKLVQGAASVAAAATKREKEEQQQQREADMKEKAEGGEDKTGAEANEA
ncbi:hypothetical protein ACJ41O_010049 [Fusarium nematophilum]